MYRTTRGRPSGGAALEEGSVHPSVGDGPLLGGVGTVLLFDTLLVVIDDRVLNRAFLFRTRRAIRVGSRFQRKGRRGVTGCRCSTT